MPSRRSGPVACALTLLLSLGLTACGDAGGGDGQAEPVETTGSTGAPVQGDPSGANTGAGGDAGGGAAVDPGAADP